MLSGLLCQAHVKEREKKTGDEEGRRRVLARRADDGDQMHQLLVRDCLARLQPDLSVLCRRWLALAVPVAGVLICFVMLCW
jgi:hypothetical protein